MLLFARRYFVALGTLLLAMGIYHMLVVPAIEPPYRETPPLPAFEPALGGEQWWQPLFAAGSWQTDNPQIFQSKRGVVLLSQEMVQEDARTMHLKPLTMIIPQTSAQDAQAGVRDVLIVSAELGAIIHFDEDIDQSGSVPSVQRGVLNGLIQIHREVHGKPNDNPWMLRTRDLSLDRSRVSTPQSVVIEWPEGVIEGHDMKLTLQGDLLGFSKSGPEASPWGPLRTLELYHLDRMQMGLENGGLWSQLKTARADNQPDLSTLPASLQVVCGGRFTFDFNRSQATLTGGVRVNHQLGTLPPDEFLCQEVALTIEPPNRSTTPRLSEVAAEAKPRQIHIKEFEATGVDSLENFVGEQKVEIRAPNIAAFASAKRMRVNVGENRIELDGKLNHAGATQSAAWLKYLGYEFTAPRIDFDADGNVRSKGANVLTDHLGYLIASGAGEVRMPPESTIGQALVRWGDSLEMRPTEIAGQQWVGLFGNVLVESALHGYMASEDLEVWLRKQEDPLAVPAQPTVPQNSRGSRSQYLPERLKASVEVNLSTPQIKAKVDELALAIRFIPPPDPNVVDSSNLSLSDSAGRPMYNFVQPPTSSQPGGMPPSAAGLHSGATVSNSPQGPPPSGDGSYVSAAPKALLSANPTAPVEAKPTNLTNSMTVVGRTLDSSIVVQGKESWVENLTVFGPLQVNGEPPNATVPSWSVIGDELQMATNKLGQVDLQITGRPAHIHLAEGSLEGPTIRFDQKSNLIWMDQPGEFTIPTSAFATQSSQTNASIEWFEPPHCTWQGRMLFDGKIVRIEGEIRFDGALAIDREQYWWVNGQSDVLEFELSEAVDLDDLKANAAQPHKVTVSKNVLIRAWQKDVGGDLKSRQQLQLPSLSFDILSHEIIGLGPGTVRSWYIGKSADGDKPGQMTGFATPNRGETQSLQGAHLVFRDSMRGFMDRSELYFQGNVELGAGPLASWEDTIDLANMQRLTLEQIRLFCDLLKVYDTSSLSGTQTIAAGTPTSGSPLNSSSKAWEFQAKGNVNFAGKASTADYEGKSSELAYVQAKELLTILGDARRPASIAITPAATQTGGGQRVIASVVYAAINPRTGALEGYKAGQEGIQVDLQNNGTVAPNAPAAPIPNPRGTVSDFFRK